MIRLSALIATASCAFLLVGCSLMQSPAVGEWSGKMSASPQSGMIGAFATGMTTMMAGEPSASLTLKSDGTGYMKVITAPEQAISWKTDGDRILLYGMGETSKGNASPAPEEPIIGKLSEDKKSLTFDLGPVQFDLTKKVK